MQAGQCLAVWGRDGRGGGVIQRVPIAAPPPFQAGPVLGAAAFLNRVFYFWKLFLLGSVSSSDTERALVTVSFKDAGAALHAQGRAAALKLRLPRNKENIDYFASYSSLLVRGIFCRTLPFSRAMAVLPPLARLLPALPGDSCCAIGLCLAVKWCCQTVGYGAGVHSKAVLLRCSWLTPSRTEGIIKQ